MSFILKIVQGPNAGAEVALVEGINLKIGKSDECDIVLADQTLPDTACELEVSAERVMMLLPGGGQERMEPYHVKEFGTNAIVYGPADAPWESLVWPEKGKPQSDETSEPEAPQTDNASEKQDTDKQQPSAERRSSALPLRSILLFIIILILAELAIWTFWPVIGKGCLAVRRCCKNAYVAITTKKTAANNDVTVQTSRTLKEVADTYHLQFTQEDNSAPVLRGNLKNRAERLKVTGEAYAIQPGVSLDLSDDESFHQSAEELLWMLTEGKITVKEAKNRCLRLEGSVLNAQELRTILKALNDDVVHLEKIDCSEVALYPVSATTTTTAAVQKKDNDSTEADTSADNADDKPQQPEQPTDTAKTVEEMIAEVTPSAQEDLQQSDSLDQQALAGLPVVGIITQPYPCIILRNGNRLTVGASLNGFVIDDISADKILLRKDNRVIEWLP